MEELRNKVAESGLITIDLEKYYPANPINVFDIKDFLFMGQILKEKDFRESLDHLDWSTFIGLDVVITCSVDAVIPMWAYMLVVSKLEGIALSIHVGSKEDALKSIFLQHIQAIDSVAYEGKRVVVKGCGDILIPEYAYVEISKKLLPVVKSLMYGEPCSTVPVFKRK
jgi:hypothetical protein